MFSISVIYAQDLVNQGRQKVIEATNALKTLSRETLEDIIARVVSVLANDIFAKRSAFEWSLSVTGLWHSSVSGQGQFVQALPFLPTVEGEPVTHRESGPVDGSGSTGQRGAGVQAQGSCVQGRPHQAADGKICSLNKSWNARSAVRF